MSESKSEVPRLLKCVVTRSHDGTATALYQFAGNPTSGGESYGDEDLSDWDDREVAELFADLIGVDKRSECFKRIHVEWE